MPLPSLYLRREPASDPVSLCLERAVPGSTKRLTNVVIYRDPECTKFAGRFAPDSTTAPRRGAKTMVLNCARWPIQWLPPVRRQVIH